MQRENRMKSIKVKFNRVIKMFVKQNNNLLSVVCYILNENGLYNVNKHISKNLNIYSIRLHKQKR